MTNIYLELKEKHQKEFNNFPMVFAFNKEQYEEGMKKLGLNPEDTDKVYTAFSGGIFRKEDSKKLEEMIDKQDKEMKEAINDKEIGEQFIFDMFNYELGNHEFLYTRDIEDTLSALGFTRKDIANDNRLAEGLEKAINYQIANDK